MRSIGKHSMVCFPNPDEDIDREEKIMRLVSRSLIILSLLLYSKAPAATPLLIAYGGHNETMAPLWVGIEKGLFIKHGVDPRVLQTRSGPIMMATLANGGSALVWAAPTSVLSASVGGMKLGAFAAGNTRIPRQLIVRKGIDSLDDLRGKTFGVQSIGGGFWLATMFVLEGLGIDAEKYKLNMRVIGDTGTVTQALVTGNVDAAVVPYSFADMAKRAGARSLADAGKIQLPYQGTVFCAPRGSSVVTSEIMTNLTKGLIEALVYIQDLTHKKDVADVLKKNLRLSKEEDIEASYNVTRLQMPTLEIAPNPEAWRAIQRLLGRVNPKVQQADLDLILMTQVARNLEASGFLPEMRKKLPR